MELKQYQKKSIYTFVDDQKKQMNMNTYELESPERKLVMYYKLKE